MALSVRPAARPEPLSVQCGDTARALAWPPPSCRPPRPRSSSSFKDKAKAPAEPRPKPCPRTCHSPRRHPPSRPPAVSGKSGPCAHTRPRAADPGRLPGAGRCLPCCPQAFPARVPGPAQSRVPSGQEEGRADTNRETHGRIEVPRGVLWHSCTRCHGGAGPGAGRSDILPEAPWA